MREMQENEMADRPEPHEQNLHQYRDLRIELGPVNANIAEKATQNPGEIEKWLVVKNGNMPVSECQVTLDDLAYYFGSEWIFPPNGYEQKALRWAQERDPQDGKIDISANESASLEIVRIFRFPNPYFGISYFDGKYGKTHHFVGKYKLRLRLNGKIYNRSSLLGIEPIIYEVLVNYASTLDFEIKDLVRVSAT